MASRAIRVNRAPVMTLWAAVVAKRLGFKWDEALTLGRAVCGLNAHSKGVSLGIFKPTPASLREHRRKAKERGRLRVELMHRLVPVVHTPSGLRATAAGRPIAPDSVTLYLTQKFGTSLPAVKQAMTGLATSLPPSELAGRAYALYTRFRPSVPAGTTGWGAAGALRVTDIRHATD
jgi:hypothetical protein